MKRSKRLKWANKLYGKECGIEYVGKIYISGNRRKFYIYYSDWTRCGPIFYARFKMEVKLRKRLKSWKDTHHIDGNTLNDKYNNLKVLGDSEHTILTHKGRHRTKESRRRMSLARVGKKLSKETRDKMSLVRFGKHASEETKRKMRMAWIKRKIKNGYIGLRTNITNNKRKRNCVSA